MGELVRCRVPIVAAVHGHCLGLGIMLVGCCDIVIASEDAVFQFTEIDNGTVGGAPMAFRMFPPQLARYYMLTGAKIPAPELQRVGALARMVPPGELLATAQSVAATIASKPPAVALRMKAALDKIERYEMSQGMLLEQRFIFELNMEGVGSERRQAFLDGNRPGLHGPKAG